MLSGIIGRISDRNQKFFVALVAAIIAIWVMILNVEIDSTIQTLILTLSPIIVAYLWPDASREPSDATVEQTTEETVLHPITTTSRKSYWGFDQDVAVALAVAFGIYVAVQGWMALQTAPDLAATNTVNPPWWAKFLIAVIPVVTGALTSPGQSSN